MNTPQDVITAWSARLLADAKNLKNLDATYKFVVKGSGGGSWLFRCKDPVSVNSGEGPADCTITMAAADFVALGKGDLNPQMAFMSGQLNIDGDIELALKLGDIIG
jgi:putative sterol carrier protein